MYGNIFAKTLSLISIFISWLPTERKKKKLISEKGSMFVSASKTILKITLKCKYHRISSDGKSEDIR